MTTSTTSSEDDWDLTSAGWFWYDKAKKGYETFSGDKGKWLTQAALWLNEHDLGLAEIAWDLVEMELASEQGSDGSPIPSKGN